MSDSLDCIGVINMDYMVKLLILKQSIISKQPSLCACDTNHNNVPRTLFLSNDDYTQQRGLKKRGQFMYKKAQTIHIFKLEPSLTVYFLPTD